MAAGGPGDHPLSDVLYYNLEVFGEKCDALIREISKYTSPNEMYEAFDWFGERNYGDSLRFESELTKFLNSVKEDRRLREWEDPI